MRHVRTNLAAGAAVAAALGLSLTACDGTADSDRTTAPATSTSSQQHQATRSPSDDRPAAGGPITKERAGTIVTDKYGGQVISVESDTEKGQATWEVEVKNSRQGRIEVDVAKATGKIVAFEHD